MTDTGPAVRDAVVGDHATVLALNNASVPNVGALTEEQFAWLAGEADCFRVAELEGRFAGFIMAIRHGTPYWSANYAWFGAHFPEFLYVDRVIVVPDAQRSGVGRAIYRDLVHLAEGRWPRITLEVNLKPPNPGSIAFHEALGFRQVGARSYGENEVAMYELALKAASSEGPG